MSLSFSLWIPLIVAHSYCAFPLADWFKFQQMFSALIYQESTTRAIVIASIV